MGEEKIVVSTLDPCNSSWVYKEFMKGTPQKREDILKRVDKLFKPVNKRQATLLPAKRSKTLQPREPGKTRPPFG